MIPIIKDKLKFKTGGWAAEIPIVTSKCIGCGTCERYCPEGAIRIVTKNNKKFANIDYDFCKGCKICANVCPIKAIEIKDKNNKE